MNIKLLHLNLFHPRRSAWLLLLLVLLVLDLAVGRDRGGGSGNSGSNGQDLTVLLGLLVQRATGVGLRRHVARVARGTRRGRVSKRRCTTIVHGRRTIVAVDRRVHHTRVGIIGRLEFRLERVAVTLVVGALIPLSWSSWLLTTHKGVGRHAAVLLRRGAKRRLMGRRQLRRLVLMVLVVVLARGWCSVGRVGVDHHLGGFEWVTSRGRANRTLLVVVLLVLVLVLLLVLVLMLRTRATINRAVQLQRHSLLTLTPHIRDSARRTRRFCQRLFILMGSASLLRKPTLPFHRPRSTILAVLRDTTPMATQKAHRNCHQDGNHTTNDPTKRTG